MNGQTRFKPNRLVSIDDLDEEDISILYVKSLEFEKILNRPLKKTFALNELTIANIFFEDSTRTRISFELAEKRLTADIVNFGINSSSVKKGETLNDTIRNLLRMKIDMIVIRHNISGSANYVFEQTRIPVINAGDGTNEHPTQALLDIFTLWKKGYQTENIQILLKGDILHSRVAGSAIKLWDKLGIKYKIEGPNTVRRKSQTSYATSNQNTTNIIYNLRIQKERQDLELIPSLEEYNEFFGTKIPFDFGKICIMHPGPINRGVELDSELADNHDSLILDQVEMGVALRMAILYLLGLKKGG